ncbi:MAG TPA: carbamoyltransferase [Pirellulales bacterium]|nr:carbamoyltransferase [Pirellulales bacterium]
MTAILGISAYYHDSAAAIVVDGHVVAAAQEERFSRKRHDPGFPAQAVAYCLKEAGLASDELDYVAFYDKPFTKFERLLETYLAYAPAGFRSFSLAIPVWLKEKLNMRRTIRRALGKRCGAKLVFVDHHESHAASAFFPSPYQEAAILTLDGVGEWTTTSCGVGENNKIRLTHHLQFPHSLGLLYSAFTYYCGFKVNSGEYKLMGLAPYGQPVYADQIYEHLLDLKPDGTFWLDMRYFNYCQGLTMTNSRFHELFGGPPRQPEARIEPRHADLAASVQAVAEEIMLRLGRDVYARTGQRRLVLAGGVALNCVANGRLLREGPFDDIWIQPAAGDAGGALGAALFVWHQLLEKPRRATSPDGQRGSLLGPAFSDDEIEQVLREADAPFERFDDEQEMLSATAQSLAEEQVVGWFQGRMEFGPRALGARSILGDPRSSRMQATMNLKVKFRESFRPFAPIVLRECASDWFAIDPRHESPYMLLVASVLPKHRTALGEQDLECMRSDPDLCRRVNVVRSTIPAVTHIDYSARLQTVDSVRNPRLHGLLKAFQDRTGCPVLINTSFNVRGEPIVCTPREAYRCFLATDIDVLVLGDFLVRKDQLTGVMDSATRQQHLAQFQLD